MPEYIIGSWLNANGPEKIVRCRDCANARIKYTAKGALKTASCAWHGRCIKPDGYCAWGERKEDS